MKIETKSSRRRKETKARVSRGWEGRWRNMAKVHYIFILNYSYKARCGGSYL